jgi:hypothetical protein
MRILTPGVPDADADTRANRIPQEEYLILILAETG